MQTYFSSDWHLGHTNILKYDNRPFASIEEMNEVIIGNHNSIVKPDDHFYFLGDFCFSKRREDIEGFMKQLNGKLFFIKGNHDHTDTRKMYAKYGTYLGDMATINVEDQEIVLCHYAMKVWNKSHRGVWHLYGHSHHTLPESESSLSFDVGCNGWDYKPLSFNEVQIKMFSKKFIAIDHHR